jgi:hypothetical protein
MPFPPVSPGRVSPKQGSGIGGQGLVRLGRISERSSIAALVRSVRSFDHPALRNSFYRPVTEGSFKAFRVRGLALRRVGRHEDTEIDGSGEEAQQRGGTGRWPLTMSLSWRVGASCRRWWRDVWLDFSISKNQANKSISEVSAGSSPPAGSGRAGERSRDPVHRQSRVFEPSGDSTGKTKARPK